MATPGAGDHRSDLELIQLCNQGNAAEAAQAFGILYERHKGYVVRVAFRFVRDHDAALDVLQETFSYLLRKFPPTGDGLDLTAELTTLLYPVAKNSAITMQRKADRFPVEEGSQPDDLAAATPSHAFDDPTGIARVLRGLSAERREVILLRFVDDLSLADIATALGVPLGTVKSRLHLALRQLRQSPDVKKLLEP